MQGLHVIRKGNSIGNIKTPFEDSKLLSRVNNFEVIQIDYSKGADLLILPLKSQLNKDFYYILNGIACIINKGKEITLKTGDSFTIQGLTEILRFKVLEDIRVLWFSSEPTFDLTLEYHDLRYKYLEKIQQRDNYTAEHCSRVSEYTLQLIKKMNFEIERIINILHSATLHDIGKIHIPDSILNKPDKLTDEEYDLMKKHAQFGYEMILDVADDIVKKAILQHHERLDGRGYPYGLKGDEILLEAKILAVIDSYDAMTSDRPYKKGMNPCDALEELKRCIGTHYEKDIVYKFEEVLIENGIV